MIGFPIRPIDSDMLSPTRRPALLRTDHFELATEAGTLLVALRRDRRARNYTLRVKGAAAAPVLTMPAYGSLREARHFLDRHVDWLVRQMAKAPAPKPIADGATIPLRGVAHLIRHAPESRGTVAEGLDDGTHVLSVTGGAEHLRRRVFDYLRREARRDLEPAVTRYASALGVRPKAVRVRDTFSRWGSCSASGELSFSFRLVMAPPFVLDYLAAHEVAHLREMNHSRRFWRLVEEVCEDRERARAWLLAEGPALHAVGA
jgi:predicted metal-dependent hydrolase